MEKIFYNNTLIAIRIKAIPKKITPVTEPDQPLQILLINHPQGKRVAPHIHTPTKRTTHRLQECLIVKKGRIKVDLYGPDKKYFKHLYLKEGEMILQINGGHGIQIIKDAELVEIKNGPFIEDKIHI